MKKLFFFIILLLATLAIVYSFVHKHFVSQTYMLIYLKSEKQIETQKNLFCYETITLDRYLFKKEERIFTVLNNLIYGPQNIYLDSSFPLDLSIRKVHLLGSTLLVDFNRNISQLSLEDEEHLLTIFINTIKNSFPEIKDMFWLLEGRELNYIKSGFSYLYPISIKNFNPIKEDHSIIDSKNIFPC